MAGVRTATVAALAISGLLAVAGCELQEVTLVEAEDVVVVEVYVELGLPGSGDRATAFLHRTLEGSTATSRPVPGASVVISRADGTSVELGETELDMCVRTTPVDASGTCYWAATGVAGGFLPGDTLDLEVGLPDGGVLRGTTTVPGDFELRTPPPPYQGDPPFCLQRPSTPLELRWTTSEGAWAYVNETLIAGLRDALEPDIRVEEDPLYLLGVSISARDTTIVFPGEFGVFGRFELDQALALELQKGLPGGTNARVTISAADRNYVNWIRGGNFNPSGQVRIPSVRGDGTGVFGSSVTRTVRVFTSTGGIVDGLPSCGG
jgi:hypothetical protein